MDGGEVYQLQDGSLIDKRQELTEKLYESPYDLIIYLQRAAIYHELGYPDLAAGDAYRALLLTDEASDEGFEYHDVTLETLQAYCEGGLPQIVESQEDISGKDAKDNIPGPLVGDSDEERIEFLAKKASVQCYRVLAANLLLCGCLKSSYDYCARGLDAAPKDPELIKLQKNIKNHAKEYLQLGVEDDIDINQLPDQGFVRRELYPWNTHEPDRHSQETLDFLNAELAIVAPKCEVLVTELPTLIEHTSASTLKDGTIATNKQLGLFAKEDISPTETVLLETSVLTANNRLKESLCDCCSSLLPPLDAAEPGVPCGDCDDTTFCSPECHDLAQETYHTAICDKDIDTIAKDPDPKETPNALYLLLLARSLAMSETQECHPLQLKEVKYIWGDFLPSSINSVPLDTKSAVPPPNWTLPFSFASNIASPLHVLEKMDIDIFATLEYYDLWIFNTLYSKFRGTASARVGIVEEEEVGEVKIGGETIRVARGGRGRGPEVAAVHPLWCLANHDCDPNVQWEWDGRMRLWARERRIFLPETVEIEGLKGRVGGIKKGEEILNHYCDVDLKVGDRREWAKGSLGGWCMCQRCRREAGEL